MELYGDFVSLNYMSIKKKIDLTPHLEILHEKKRRDSMETSKHLEKVSKIMGKNPSKQENKNSPHQENFNINREDLSLDEDLVFNESQIAKDFEPANSVEEVSFNHEGSNIFENVNRILKNKY